MNDTTYMLDANVLIQAWQKYYAPRLCPGYWEPLNALGEQGRIFLPRMVAEEINRTDDELKAWLTSCRIPIQPISSSVAEALTRIYTAHPFHPHLVDNIKGRSLADPWIIAHALVQGACVVTKEERVLQPNTPRIRIPNVCDHMGIPCITDFDMLAQLGVRFMCERGS